MGRKILLLSLVVVCGLAIGCGVPTSSQTASDNLELYAIWPPGGTMMLETVGSWEGSDSRDIYFEADKSPWVINAGYRETSKISSSFQVAVQSEEAFRRGSHLANFLSQYNNTFEGTGSFVIIVFASGCEWWLKVGVEPSPTPPSEATKSAILGKWRHGLPEECPPQMSQQQYEELRELPESKTYYLEFFEDGNVQFICEGQIIDGTYTFISDEEVEISWNVLGGTLAEFFDGDGVYQVVFSEDKMTLWGGLEECATYLRAD
jgi:hypothetical protein